MVAASGSKLLPVKTRAEQEVVATTPPTAEKIPERLICYGTGDPHIFPFIGGKYDLHHAGVFSVLKSDKLEVQAKLETCRSKQKWSAGLSIKCITATAVRFGGGQVLETSIESRGLTLNGKALTSQKDYDSGESIIPGALAGASKETKHTLDAPTFQLRLWTMTEYATFILALKDSSSFGHGRSPGLCGGGGLSQYTKVANQDKAEDNMARIANGGAEIGYPCKKCIAGLGYMGAMCSCHEFLVAESDEIFSKKLAEESWEDDSTDDQSEQLEHDSDLREYKSKCLDYLLGKPMGALAFQHAALKHVVIDAVGNCAEDIAADEVPEGQDKVLWNEDRMNELICEEMEQLVDDKKVSKVLCELVHKCGMKSEKCKGS